MEPVQSCMPPEAKAWNDDLMATPTLASDSKCNESSSVASSVKRRHTSLAPLLPKVAKSLLTRRGTTGSQPRPRPISTGHTRRISFSASSETCNTDDSDGFLSAKALNSVSSDLSSHPSAQFSRSLSLDAVSVSTVSNESPQSITPSLSSNDSSVSMRSIIWKSIKDSASRVYHEPFLSFMWYFFIDVLVYMIGVLMEVFSFALPIVLRVCESTMLFFVNQVYVRRFLIFLYELFKPRKKMSEMEESNANISDNVPKRYGRLRKLRIQNNKPRT
jgi:hypothetical protein